MARDVVFNLKIVPGDTKALSQFGADVKRQQKDIDDSALASAKRLAKERDKLASDSAAWHAKVQAKSAQLEQSENVRLAREAKRLRDNEIREQERADKRIADFHVREHIAAMKRVEAERQASLRRQESDMIKSVRRMAQAQNQLRMSGIGQAQGLRTAAGGAASVARGVAYSGLIGEEDAQALLNKLLAIEATFETLRGGIEVWKGLTQWATNYRKAAEAAATIKSIGGIGQAAAGSGPGAIAGIGTAGGGGAAAGAAVAPAAVTAAAALAAVASSALASVVAFETIRDASKYGIGGGARPGSVSDRIGGGFSNVGTFFARLAPQSVVDHYAEQGDTNYLRVKQERAMERQSREAAQYREMYGGARARISEGLSGLAGQKFTNLDDARAAMLEAKGIESDLRPISGPSGSAEARKAIQNIEGETLRLIKEQGSAAIEASKSRLASAREELSIHKETAQTAKQAALEARQAHTSDLAKFGMMTPEQQAEVRQIAAKKATGQALSTEEIGIASQFNEFEQFGESSAVARAKAAGAGTIFTDTAANLVRAENDAKTAAAAVAKSEVKVKQETAVVVQLESSDGLEGDLKKEFDALAKIIAERDKETRAKWQADIRQALSTFNVTRNANVK